MIRKTACRRSSCVLLVRLIHCDSKEISRVNDLILINLGTIRSKEIWSLVLIGGDKILEFPLIRSPFLQEQRIIILEKAIIFFRVNRNLKIWGLNNFFHFINAHIYFPSWVDTFLALIPKVFRVNTQCTTIQLKTFGTLFIWSKRLKKDPTVIESLISLIIIL